MELFYAVANVAKLVNKIRYVCKEIALSELNLRCFDYYYSRLPRATTSLFLTSGKPVPAAGPRKLWKIVLCTKLCPLCM